MFFAEAAVEQNAALGSFSRTSREQDEARLCETWFAQYTGPQCLPPYISLKHTHIYRDKTGFIRDDEVKGFRDAETERK